jgi:transcription termination factor Rho
MKNKGKKIYSYVVKKKNIEDKKTSKKENATKNHKLEKLKKDFFKKRKIINFKKNNLKIFQKKKRNSVWSNKIHSSFIEKNINVNKLSKLSCFITSSILNDLKKSFVKNKHTKNRIVKFNEIYKKSIRELHKKNSLLKIDYSKFKLNRDYLIISIIKYFFSKKILILVEGVLGFFSNYNYGLLVYKSDSYFPKPLSCFVSNLIIKKYGLRVGHSIKALMHPPIFGEYYPFIFKLIKVEDKKPSLISKLVRFNELIPYYPTKRLLLESFKNKNWNNTSMRIIDIFTPIGLGQRGLIVAPPRTGKTILLQSIANSIVENNANVKLIILLIDERPEEVTDFKRMLDGRGEIISSTFDEPSISHVYASEMSIHKARRMVEAGYNVIILLDSLTRLARAYNTIIPSSGKILSGGVDASALQRPKNIFGAARNIEGFGSLTIIASALVDTGSRMDEVIFEEFKGTGNMELHLDRTLTERRIFPSLNIERSGTRKEELLYHPDELGKIYFLRRTMKNFSLVEGMSTLIKNINKTKSNVEFLMFIKNLFQK